MEKAKKTIEKKEEEERKVTEEEYILKDKKRMFKKPALMVELFVHAHDTIRRDEESGLFYEYKSEVGYFQLLDQEKNHHGIKQKVYDFLKKHEELENFSPSYMAGVLQALSHVKEINIPSMDGDKNLLLLKNGVYDFSQDKLISHSPDYHLSAIINVSYDPDAPPPEKFLEFIRSTFQKNGETDPVLIDSIIEICGFLICPLGIREAEKMFIFLGEGQNGKSVLLNILQMFIHKDFVTSLSLENIIGKPSDFYRMQLIKSRLNICAEEKSVYLDSSAELKKIISGEKTTINVKHQPPFSIIPRTKIIIACNELPRLGDHTRGGMRRLLIIEFPNTFMRKAEYTTQLKEHTVEQLSEKGIFLGVDKIEKIVEVELPGIFNLLLSGLKRLIKNNFEFTISQNSVKCQNRYLTEDSSIYHFLSERYNRDDTGFIPSQHLYEEYRNWHEKNVGGHLKLNIGKFYKEVKRVFGTEETRGYFPGHDGVKKQYRGTN